MSLMALFRLVSVFFVLVILIQGCTSTPAYMKKYQVVTDDTSSHLKGLPADAMRRSEGYDINDIQHELADRNLYINHLGVINFIDDSSCAIELISDHGSDSYPEGSIDAILTALASGYDGVYVSVRQLKSGQWVIHHDAFTGRVTASKKPSAEISQLSDKEWKRIKFKASEFGSVMDLQPHYLAEVAEAFSALAKPQQALYINIESDVDLQTDEQNDLQGLLSDIQAYLNYPQYHLSSSNIALLKRLRELDAKIQLVVKQTPTGKSIEMRNAALRQASSGRQRDVQLNNITNVQNKDNLNMSLVEISTALKGSSLLVDSDRYSVSANKTFAKKHKSIKKISYSLGDSAVEIDFLKRQMKRDRLPEAGMVKSSAYQVCQNLFGTSKNKSSYQVKTELGEKLQKLPEQAQFTSIDELIYLLGENEYKNLDGKRREIPDVGRKSLSINTADQSEDIQLEYEPREKVTLEINNKD